MAAKKKSPHTDSPTNVPATVDENFNQVRLKKEAVSLPDLSADEKGYLVEGKYYAAVRYARGDGAAAHTFGVTCFAYARDQVGRPYLNAMGTAIEGAFTCSCDKKDLISNNKKVNEVRDSALDGALREMLAHIAENVAFENLKV